MDTWAKAVMAEIQLPPRPGPWRRFWSCRVRARHRWVRYGDIFPREKCLRCGRDRPGGDRRVRD